MANLKVGDQAPNFSVETELGKVIKLTDLGGKYVVLYFYPKDDTPGCTMEALDFNALLPQFEKSGAVVLGISRDDHKSHDKFKDKYQLKFSLGADTEGKVCSNYSVWVEKSMFGKKYMGVNRATFLIDKEGKIAHIWPKVSVDGHAREVLTFIQNL